MKHSSSESLTVPGPFRTEPESGWIDRLTDRRLRQPEHETNKQDQDDDTKGDSGRFSEKETA